MDKYRNAVLDILKEVNQYDDIEADTDLLEAGILNSLNLLYLMEELEDQFGVTIPESEVKPENFCSVEQVALLLDRLTKKG